MGHSSTKGSQGLSKKSKQSEDPKVKKGNSNPKSNKKVKKAKSNKTSNKLNMYTND